MAVVVFLGFHDVQDGGVNFATRLIWTIWCGGFRLGREAAGAGSCARSSSG